MTTQTAVDPAARTYRTVNPATGEVVREFPTLDDAQAQARLARAHAAYLRWREVPVPERVRLFARFAELIDANAGELARLTTLEMGKPLAQSQGEAGIVVRMFRYYAQHGEELLADEETQLPGFIRAITRREPVGVVLGIEPWNGPLYQAMRATAPNLMLGNTVLLKPSEVSAGSTLVFDHLFAEAGFPADVYQTVLVSTAQVSGYIADPRVRGVTLTGSDRAGSAVGEQAGRNIKPVVLELGGSDAFIVLDSADVARAAGTVAACGSGSAARSASPPSASSSPRPWPTSSSGSSPRRSPATSSAIRSTPRPRSGRCPASPPPTCSRSSTRTLSTRERRCSSRAAASTARARSSRPP